jgi:hypothetical protein
MVDNLFGPEWERARLKKKSAGLGDQIASKATPRKGGLISRFVSASADTKAPQFNTVVLPAQGRAAKQEEKGLVIPRVNYVSDEDTNGQT